MGGALAACLPVMVYLSQYISNEGFAAACVSGLHLSLFEDARREQNSWKEHAVLGFCLGVAMLGKSTALLALPRCSRADLARTANGGWNTRSSQRARKSDCGKCPFAAVCVAVCGWHYGRT